MALLTTRIGGAVILCIVLPLVLLVNSLIEWPIAIEQAARMDEPARLPCCSGWCYRYCAGRRVRVPPVLHRCPVRPDGDDRARRSESGGGIASAVMIVSVQPPLLISLLAYRFIGRALTASAVKG